MRHSIKQSDFEQFFKELNEGFSPFPWQRDLSSRLLSEGKWPDSIDLPTSFGKTSCLQVALFALAALGKAMPRRIFFVVDRRLIVDEAFEQASRWQEKIESAADSGILLKVKENLLDLAGVSFLKRTRPLEVVSLRGGVFRENRWTENPSAPTLICTTVDQIGSRLFFRGYGVSRKTLPRHAALVGNDSLILLDEAHCSRPFEQTMRRFETYRHEEAGGPYQVSKPSKFVVMTATPSSADEEPFRFGPEDLKNDVLAKRYNVQKPTKLVVADGVKGFKFSSKLSKFIDQQLKPVLKEGNASRIGIIVNNVDTARKTERRLKKAYQGTARVVLMTGRMRELDRSDLLERHSPFLKSGSEEPLPEPLIVVATQCLEVGADFDFDFLLLECADLAAVEQRMGRLNRLGEKEAKAVLFVREDQQTYDDKKADPIYGEAMPHTWAFLREHCTETDSGAVIDLGIAHLRSLKENLSDDEKSKLQTKATDAPILLPPYLDCWTQTSPQPEPQAEVSPFLRGEERASTDVQVVWRHGVQGTAPDTLLDQLQLRPITSSETLQVPLRLFRDWLRSPETAQGSGEDLEGFENIQESSQRERNTLHPSLEKAVFRFSGVDEERNRFIGKPLDARPNELFIIDQEAPAPGNLGDLFDQPQLQRPRLDRGDEAQYASRKKLALTLSKDRLEEYQDVARAVKLMEHEQFWKQLHDFFYPASKPKGLFDADLLELEELYEILEATPTETEAAPGFYNTALEAARSIFKTGAKPNPFQSTAEGPFHYIFLCSIKTENQNDLAEEIETLGGDLQSVEGPVVSLEEHCARVGSLAASLADSLGFSRELIDDLRLAGWLHDLGKSDVRFQAFLRGGSLSLALGSEVALAKSGKKFSLSDMKRFRSAAGYPAGKRHEYLSAALLEIYPHLLKEAHDPELVKYLVAVHHGYARPWPLEPEDTGAELVGAQIFGIQETAPFKSDYGDPGKGHARRFWDLQKKYGRWQLALLETVLTAADGMSSGSRDLEEKREASLSFPEGSPFKVAARPSKVVLSGLDGSNLLAFLSALGTLRLLDRHSPELNWKLGWDLTGVPKPYLTSTEDIEPTLVLEKLDQALKDRALKDLLEELPDPNKFGLGASIDSKLDNFHAFAERYLLEPGRFKLNWLCASAAPIHRYVAGKQEPNLGNTAFRTLGSGRTSFIAALQKLYECTELRHLERTLFKEWDYKDLKNNLRLDGIDDRRYALMGSTPTNDAAEPTRTMWGANRLAFEAFPLFPVWPGIRRVDTAGFVTSGSLNTYFYWSLWEKPLSLPAARSLLWQRDWHRYKEPEKQSLGIGPTYRAQRFNFGKYRNFAPSEALGQSRETLVIHQGERLPLLRR